MRAYMLALSKDQELTARWQRAAQSLLAETHIGPLSKQIAFALFYEGKLVLAAWRRERNSRIGSICRITLGRTSLSILPVLLPRLCELG
jgi:hypothetical protein